MLTAKLATTDYLHPAAPADYGVGRRCHRGRDCVVYAQIGEVGKINRFSVPHTWGGVLLCSSCEKRRVDEDLDPAPFVGRQKRPKQAGRFLPGLSSARKEAHLAQKTLAVRACCTYDHLRAVEAGRTRSGHKLEGRIAEALGVSRERLRGAS